jgi:hypothetical protein
LDYKMPSHMGLVCWKRLSHSNFLTLVFLASS